MYPQITQSTEEEEEEEKSTDRYLWHFDVCNVVSRICRWTGVNDSRREVIHIVMATSESAEVQLFRKGDVGWHLDLCHQFPGRRDEVPEGSGTSWSNYHSRSTHIWQRIIKHRES